MPVFEDNIPLGNNWLEDIVEIWPVTAPSVQVKGCDVKITYSLDNIVSTERNDTLIILLNKSFALADKDFVKGASVKSVVYYPLDLLVHITLKEKPKTLTVKINHGEISCNVFTAPIIQ